jgi:hypothetical protein
MSSPATSPYQSKLFNFLNRQSQRWQDRLGTAARHLKVTAEWGIQVMLYPIYLLVQAGRMAGKELEQAVTHAQLPAATEVSAPAIDSDRAIVQVLDLWQNETGTAIQGIACFLESRRFALVTTENSLLDILSPEQEKTLLARIRTEVANYWHDRRLAQTEAQKLPAAIPNFEGEAGDKVLPPARFFWKVMGWVQRSPLAIATNLFGESRFAGLPGGAEKPDIASLLPSEAFVARLDCRVAELEIAPLAAAKQLLQQFSQQLQVVYQQHFQPLTAKAASATLNWENAGNIPQNADPFAIQALILAAVDYFFGQRSEAGIGGTQVTARGRFLGKKNPAAIGGESPTAFSLLPAASESEAPWLTWEDLFDKSPAPAHLTAATPAPELPASLPSGLPIPSQPNTVRSRKVVAGEKQRSRGRMNRLAKRQETVANPVCVPQASAEVVPAAEPPDSLETAFDWLEAEVVSTGYVKHPLEQVLEWLDRFILWLEQLLAKLWKNLG